MIPDAFIVTATAVLSGGLWVRRITWHCLWERATTLSLTLQLVAVVLIAPQASPIFGRLLYGMTGHQHVDSCLGECAFVVGAATLMYSLACRVAVGDTLTGLVARIQLVITFALPAMVAAFWLSRTPTEHYRPNIFDVPCDGWLRIFWLLLCTSLSYFLGYAAYLAVVARRDPRIRIDWVRKANTLYITGCGGGIAAAADRAASVIFAPDGMPFAPGGASIWLLAALGGSCITVASALSWRAKTQWITPVRARPTGRAD